MSEKKYLDSDTAYNAGTLSDWYISSVDDSGPIWTELLERIEGLEHTVMLLEKLYKNASKEIELLKKGAN